MAQTGERWMLVEARVLPVGCTGLHDCFDNTNPLFRTLMALDDAEREQFAAIINGMSDHLDVPEIPGAEPLGAEALHALDGADKPQALLNHPGVYFDASGLASNPLTASLSDVVEETLATIGLPRLTEAERDATPGRPTLKIRFSAHREAGGCVYPFQFFLAIEEEVVLVRDTGLKYTTSIWSSSAREDLAILNFSPRDAIASAMDKLANDYLTANSIPHSGR